jgi:3-phenylpropionate/trans-cinnamate dioxygenase ferredoxin reductase component
MTRMVVVGAGHAAGQAVASMRQDKYEGEIVVIGDEAHVPYQRPPLSKQYLSDEHGIDRVYLRPAAFYSERNIRVLLGTRATAIDRARRTVTTDSGETIEYTKLLLATGGRARKLSIPGSDLPGIYYLRTISDVDAIKTALVPGAKLAIVGGGYIGLEVAAVTVKRGFDVTVVEMEERILKRVTTAAMSAFYDKLHTSRGVKIVTSARCVGFEGTTKLTGVKLDGRPTLPADVAIVGVGIIPNVELATAAGLECENGIRVDDHCRTSDPDIFAAGDCTNHPNALLGRRLRLESVPNATDQARVAVTNMLGGDATYAAIPWFWSDQYELKLQMVGFSSDGDTAVVRGDPAKNQFATFYLKNGALVAVDAVNSPKEFMACRQLVARGAHIDPKRLADPTVQMKELLSA